MLKLSQLNFIFSYAVLNTTKIQAQEDVFDE
jgi:hypothetical protein